MCKKQRMVLSGEIGDALYPFGFGENKEKVSYKKSGRKQRTRERRFGFSWLLYQGQGRWLWGVPRLLLSAGSLNSSLRGEVKASCEADPFCSYLLGAFVFLFWFLPRGLRVLEADIKNTYIYGKCLSHILFWKDGLYSDLPGGDPGAWAEFLPPFKAEVGTEHRGHSGSVLEGKHEACVIGKKQLKIFSVCVLGCVWSN